MEKVHINLSPQKAQRTPERTRMTRIERIFTDIFNPCVSAFICVHLRLNPILVRIEGVK